MQFDSGYILKVEVTDGLNVDYEKMRGIKNNSKAFERWNNDVPSTEKGKTTF